MNYALILAGGSGQRIGRKIPKQFIEVYEKPIFIYALEIFQGHPQIDEIILVCVAEWEHAAQINAKTFGISKLTQIINGGETRQESVLNGLLACRSEKNIDDDIVIVHDAARPLVSSELITQCIKTAKKYGGCMPVLPVKDTIYHSRDGKSIDGLLDRNTLYAGQAPEAFRLKPYTDMNLAISHDEMKSYHGSSEIVYRYGESWGVTMKMIEGEDSNFKITTQQDLERFRVMVQR